MYLEYHADGHFEAATGTLQGGSTDGLIDFRAHIWIEDSLDGGASRFVTHVGRKELGRYLQEPRQSDEVGLEWQAESVSVDEEEGARAKGPVKAHCHCYGVEFYVHPPNQDLPPTTESNLTPLPSSVVPQPIQEPSKSTPATTEAGPPFPDLIIPYNSTTSPANPKNLPWHLQHNATRYLAGTCSCTTCRQTSGFDLTFWSFIPTSHITRDAAGTQRFTRDPYWGSMKTYSSSAGVTRTFCSGCGAGVFWDGSKRGRGDVVDVKVGLLAAREGARAEGLLAWWTGRTSFAEEAANKGLVAGLEEGLKEWGRKNEGSGVVAKWDGAVKAG